MALKRSPLPSSSTITTLPVELLTIILTIVRNNTPVERYLDTLLCCRQWWEIGQDILCQDIVLTSSTITTFVERLSPRSFSKIRTITISFNGQEHLRLERMIKALGQLTRLHTFSFTVLHGPIDANTSPDFRPRSRDVWALLDNLPRSVSNLNLDIAGYGSMPPSQKAIRNIVQSIPPQIVNLRLRLGSLEMEEILKLINHRQRDLRFLHVDVCRFGHDLDPLPPSNMAHLNRLTSTRVDFPVNLVLARPFEFQITDHVTEDRMTTTVRAIRIFISNGDGAWNYLPRIALTFDSSKPEILVPQDPVETFLSAVAGWYQTATGALLPGFQDLHEYDSWLGIVSEKFGGNTFDMPTMTAQPLQGEGA